VQMAHSVTQNTMRTTSKEESREMMAMWADVVRDITDAIKDLKIPDVSKWIEKVLQYNVPGGKRTRGLTLIYAYKSLAPKEQLTEDNISLAWILAWCMELVQGCVTVIDDIQDRSLVRRGKPCWYLHENIGVAAVNDSLMIKDAMFYLMEKHFKGKECYLDLLETFHNIIFKSTMGQCLDLLIPTNYNKKLNLDLFTMDRYSSIIKYKTAYYSFVLPIITAMHFAGIKDPVMFQQAETVLLEIGHLFQVQDDYLSCFGDSEVFGKDNTDIEEGKCTWLVVVALQRATPEQRRSLEECYGFSDPEKVRRVKQLFTDLDLPKIYSLYEEKTYNLINEHIQQICGLPHNMFLYLLQKLYHRTS